MISFKKLSISIYFWELNSNPEDKNYGYIFRNAEENFWVVKKIRRCPHDIKSIYIEKTEKFWSLKECKIYLNEIYITENEKAETE